MTERELALLEKLLEDQKELIGAITALADAQYLIAQALTPITVLAALGPDDGPQTLQ